MIVNLEKYRAKRREEQDYRRQLVDEIVRWHQQKPASERADSFYFEHIRAHFSIDMLEDILSRLQQRVSNE